MRLDVDAIVIWCFRARRDLASFRAPSRAAADASLSKITMFNLYSVILSTLKNCHMPLVRGNQVDARKKLQ